jgi:hypothetical protein
MDGKGNRDGRGISIFPGKGMYLGHYNNDKPEGPMTAIGDGIWTDEVTKWHSE